MPFALSPRFVVAVSAVLLLAGCSRPLPIAAYRAYLADPANGLTHTREVNGATVSCTYHPGALLLWQELQTAPARTAPVRDSLARLYAGKTYCALSFSRNGSEIENALVTNPAAYQQALTYLNTGLAADSYLATSPRDSVRALASMYVRQYGSTGKSTVLLVFNTSKLTPEKGFHLTLLPQPLGLSRLRFPFAGRDLAALPALQYD